MSIIPGMFPHRLPNQSRVVELLENLKAEFEALAHEANHHKMQKDDLERKLQNQLTELTNLQNTIYEIERAHTKIKQQYEDDTLRVLKRQLEIHSQNGSSSPYHPNGSSNETPRGTPSSEKSLSSLGSSQGVFGNYSAGTLAPIVDKRSFTGSVAGKRTRLETERDRDSPFYSTTGGNTLPSLSGLTENPSSSSTLSSLSSSTKHQKIDKSDSSFTLPNPNFRETPVKEPLSRTPSLEVHSPKESVKDLPLAKPNPEPRKREDDKSDSDWALGYPPNIPPSLKVDLCHTLDHNSVVCCVKFSSDGKYLATGCNKSAQIFDVESGELVKCFSDETAKDVDLYIRSVSFSPDGKYLAAGAEDRTVKIWDIESQASYHVLSGHELDIYSLDFSHNGNIIVSGSGDRRAKIWDLASGKCLYTLGNEETGPKDGVTSVALSPDGRFVAAGSLDHHVRLWDVHTGQFLDKFEGHGDSVYSVAFSPDGKSLASGSLDKTIKLWDLSQSSRSRPRCTLAGHKDFVLSVAFSPDGHWLVSGSKDRTVHFWELRNATLQTILHGHKNSVISVALSPTNGMFATGSGDYRARIWRY